MPGGSSNKKNNKPKEVAKQNYAQGPTMQTTQPFAPGMQQLLAEQLSAGYGAPVSSNMGLLDNIYDPMTQAVYQEPISVTQEAMKTGKWNNIKTGNLTLDNLLNNKAVGTPYPSAPNAGGSSGSDNGDSKTPVRTIGFGLGGGNQPPSINRTSLRSLAGGR